MKKTLLTAAIALTGLAAFNSAHAANGDLYLGFETASGTGSSVNYVVDLGAAVNLSSLNINIATDLAATYGANWYSRTDLYYGIIGAVTPAVNGDPNYTLYASVTSGGTPWTSASSSSQHGTANQVNTMVGQYITDVANGQLGTAANSVLMATSEGGSWSALSTYGIGSFGGFPGSIETGTGSALDVLRLVPNASGPNGTLAATINLASNGSLSAVPEPSTYALFGLGALLLVIAVRRRNA